MKKSAITAIFMIVLAAFGSAVFAEDEDMADPIMSIPPMIDRKNPENNSKMRDPIPKKGKAMPKPQDLSSDSARQNLRPDYIPIDVSGKHGSKGSSGSPSATDSRDSEAKTSTGAVNEPESRSVYAGVDPEKMMKADPDIMRIIELLTQEIERDRGVTVGDLSAEGLDGYRSRLPGDMERKKTARDAISNKTGVSQALDLIDRTLILEEDIIASKSKSSDKRRQTQRHALQGIGYKREAVDILKSKIGG